jgi:hypothetical protein
MTAPYEFGRHFGALSKAAAEKEARGILADMALYSNPWTGVPTGIYDTYNSLRSGNYLGALGNVANTGLSLVGGGAITSGLKSLGGGLMRAGARAGASTLLPQAARGAVQTGLNMAGRGVAATGRALGAAGGNAANRLGEQASQALSRGVQKVVPVRAGATFFPRFAAGATTKWNPARATVNAAVKNPLVVGAALHTGGQPNPPPPIVRGAQMAGQAANSMLRPTPPQPPR